MPVSQAHLLPYAATWAIVEPYAATIVEPYAATIVEPYAATIVEAQADPDPDNPSFPWVLEWTDTVTADTSGVDQNQIVLRMKLGMGVHFRQAGQPQRQ